MPSDTPPPRKPFTVFRSAAEEAAIRVEAQRWEQEDGRAQGVAPRVMHVPGAKLPYQAVLPGPLGQALHRSFATMREAEAFIRCNSPLPVAALSALYDRPAPKT